MNYLHNDSLKTVRLYGSLGAKFGREYKLQVQNFAEAIQALCAMVPGFEKELVSSEQRGVGYVCLYDKEFLTEENLVAPANNATIRIAPVVGGAKRGGLGQILLGAVIVAASFVFAPAAAAGSATFLGMSGGYAIAAQFGVSMMLGGVVQALSPQQRGLSTADGPNNGASYNFNSIVNTTAQGNCVPLGYGRMRVGSAVISSGFYPEDQV